jgi:dTDP-4-dehydrorhamnose 3,5-epimerase
MAYNKEMKIYRSDLLPDILVFEPEVFIDERGNIYSSYSNDLYRIYLPGNIDFIHDKFAESRYNVLRGLHGDNKTWKLVSCVWGELFEVVADIRPDSETFRKWDSFILSSEKYRQVLIPPGFVNGYYVMSPNAVFHYKLAYAGDYNDADKQQTIKWNDQELDIKWPCSNPILQQRDR